MPWTRRYDEAEPQRVNRWLAQSGVCSRREAEGLIAGGLVSIDGERVDDAGRKILPGQILTLADRSEAALPGFTAVLHKPVGYVSGQPEPGYTPAVRLLTRQALVGACPEIPKSDASLPPLGRLDLDSRGLLLLSDDGVLAKALIGPDSQLDKEYEVRVSGRIDEPTLALLRHGLELDGRQLKPAGVEVIEGQFLRFVLREGRKRQIRRMCELVGLRVMDLFRVRVGPLRLGDLREGRWRVLSAEERARHPPTLSSRFRRRRRPGPKCPVLRDLRRWRQPPTIWCLWVPDSRCATSGMTIYCLRVGTSFPGDVAGLRSASSRTIQSARAGISVRIQRVRRS
jgi:23S rRNA pseudouridine2604 synthase